MATPDGLQRAGESACFGIVASAPRASGSPSAAGVTSTEISTITASGRIARTRRAATMPPIPGIRTSMMIRSGARSAASSTDSSPDDASPTSSNSSVASTTERATRRNSSWSSTTSTPHASASRGPSVGAELV